MKKMYLILSNSDTNFSKLLRRFTKAHYNHVSFTFDEDCKKMYSFARWVTWFPVLSGFEIENINKGVLRKKPQTECMIYEINLTDEQYNKIMENLLNFLQSPRYHHWYNFIALPCIQFNLPYRSKKSFVCSTFVAYVLKDILNFNKSYKYITPNNYLALNYPVAYVGKLKSFIDLNETITA